jgi:hypothetical protein
MYTETWINASCPGCDKANWLNNGDVSDMTVTDVNGFKCWNCGKCFTFDDEEYMDPGETDFEEGQKKPT